MTDVNDSPAASNEARDPNDPSSMISSWRTSLARRSVGLTKPAELLLRLSTLIREAFPVGLLRAHEIEHVVRKAYRDFPDFYDPDKYQYQYESELLPLIKEATQGKRLLDLYCGQGREAAIFADAGFDVFGVDEDERSIEKARAYLARSQLQAEFTAGNVDQWQPERKDWDVVYSSLWMYSCIPDRAARREWLQRLSDWLHPQGVLVISVTPRPSQRAAQIRNVVAKIVSFASLNRRTVELGDRFDTHLFWHDFIITEVEAELAQAGFRAIGTLEISGPPACTFVLAKRDDISI